MSCSKMNLLSWALGLFCVAGCTPAEPDEAPTNTRRQAQLSGGPGVSVFDFVVNSERIGTVLVTDGAFGDGYADQYEFWLWDPEATEDIRDGDITDFTIKAAWVDDKWSPTAASIFESGTNGWTAFAIPREFELQTEPRWAWTHEPSERYTYELIAPAWGEGQGDIHYYLELDFRPNSDIPSMEWLVDANDMKQYYISEDSDEDADEWTLPPEAQDDAVRWEVRLTDDTELSQVDFAWAYELTTVYPPQ